MTKNIFENFSNNSPKGESFVPVQRAKYDFAVAYPDPESIPIDGLTNSISEALSREGKDLAIYPDKQGYPPLRQFVAEKLLLERQIPLESNEIILTSGSNQAIYMTAEILLDTGDVVITDDFLYSGTINIFQRFGAKILGIPSNNLGIDVECLEKNIKKLTEEKNKPKLIYLIPTFQNPQGWSLDLEKRKQIVLISKKYSIPILEDDCYVDLSFYGENLPSIKSLDPECDVIYVGSFSKTIAPGMRMGFLTAPEEYLNRLRRILPSGGVNQFASLAIYHYSKNSLPSHIESINKILLNKKNTMISALEEYFGKNAKWNNPNGGLYIWVKLPKHSDTSIAEPIAFNQNVGFLPGVLFSADGFSGKNKMRLCFGFNQPKEIQEGIKKLSNVFYELDYL